ncbi:MULTISPECIES: hypothetical protein [Sediminibacillus]|uniref:hypothetical protein n=1 Tax=Sediminibacillus TaxID=482460 RepID=UPI000421A32B|nr:hypothetical protein [Sediminibacillus terrae]
MITLTGAAIYHFWGQGLIRQRRSSSAKDKGDGEKEKIKIRVCQAGEIRDVCE